MAARIRAMSSDQNSVVLEAEMSALGSMILKEVAAQDLGGYLTEEDFYYPAHREIFAACKRLLNRLQPVDLVTLKSELETKGKLEQAGGDDYLIQIAECVPSAANAMHYAEIVRGNRILRQLRDAGREIVSLVSGKVDDIGAILNRAESLIYNIRHSRTISEPRSAAALAKEYSRIADEWLERETPRRGVMTGFVDLDNMTGGLFAGNLMILAARPSMGKTALALTMALQMSLDALKDGSGHGTVFFSMEMSGEELAQRAISILGQTDARMLVKPTQEVYRQISNGAELLYPRPLYVDESSRVTPMEVLAKSRRIAQKCGGLRAIFVDYLQIASSGQKTSNRVEEVGTIAEGLKTVAKELSVPVIALAQLNRDVEKRENRRPQLSDLRDSGSIEAAADTVAFLYRENYYKQREKPEEADTNPDRVEVAELIIAKQRNGSTGVVQLAYQPKHTAFNNLAK